MVDQYGNFDQTFYGQCSPITDQFIPDALKISGFTRKEHEEFPTPYHTFCLFDQWLKKVSDGQRPVFVSDNNGFDFGWINYYFWETLNKNPFGWSSRNIPDMFSGFMNDPRYRWKKHRITKHTHNPVDDAKGNAEALHWLIKAGYKMPL